MAKPSCPRDSASFSWLHLRHEQATFPHVCVPPSASETMCSSSGALSSWVPRLLLSVLTPHRWQRHLSRSNTLMGSMGSTCVFRFFALYAAAFMRNRTGLCFSAHTSHRVIVQMYLPYSQQNSA